MGSDRRREFGWAVVLLATSGFWLGCEIEPNPSPTSEPPFGGGSNEGPDDGDGTLGGMDVIAPGGPDANEWATGSDASGPMADSDVGARADTSAGEDAVSGEDTVGSGDTTDGQCQLVCPLGCTITSGSSAVAPPGPTVASAIALTSWTVTPQAEVPLACPAGTPLASLVSLPMADAAATALAVLGDAVSHAWVTDADGATTRLWPLRSVDCAADGTSCSAAAARPPSTGPACSAIAAEVVAPECVASPCTAHPTAAVLVPLPIGDGEGVVTFEGATIDRRDATFTLCGTLDVDALVVSLDHACATLPNPSLVGPCMDLTIAVADAAAGCPSVGGHRTCTLALTAAESNLLTITWPEPTP